MRCGARLYGIILGMFPKVVLEFVLAAVVSAGTDILLADSAPAPQTDGEVWNEGVEYFRNNDVTNALRVLRPLMLSKTHGARAAEVVAKLE